MSTLFAEAVHQGGLPPRPDPGLDPYLDAAEACVRRYGWSRTSPRDIAREAGVDRTTIYRNLGPKDAIFRLLVAREVHRQIDRSITVGATLSPGPGLVVELLASAVESVSANPVISKLLDDDPELLTGFLSKGIPDILERFSSTLSPLLAMAMDAGVVARRDPVALTEWVVRIGMSLLVAPPPGELRSFLAEILDPVLAVVDGAEQGG